MGWDFSTEPEFQAKLDWAAAFVREEVEPLDLLAPGRAYQPPTGALADRVAALKARVRDAGLWACHLGPDLGGGGYGQVRLALLNEILGRSAWAPVVFGMQAPDTGNAEIIARYGTEEQKRRYLRPLLAGEIFSSYSMTEPHAGSDPTLFTTAAVPDTDGWVLTGRKYFTSNARSASVLIVLAVTDPDRPPYERMSMFLVPADASGVEVERDIGTIGEPLGEGMHALVRYDGVRLPADSLLGPRGAAFSIAQTRLSGGRLHHAMRTVGQCQRAFDMMCERVLSRQTRDGPLADKQLVQAAIADSYAQLQQFRLFVLYTAWLVDHTGDYNLVRKDIAAVKALTPQVLHDVVSRAIHVHGALGVSNETPLAQLWGTVPVMAVVDGPTEVHQVTVARQVLRGYRPATGEWPTEYLPDRLAAARARFEDL